LLTLTSGRFGRGTVMEVYRKTLAALRGTYSKYILLP